jgi:hypothetical protein
VHAVDGDEFFGQGIGGAVLLDSATWDAADDFARLGDAAEHLGELLADDAPPVGTHSDFQGGMREDGWRPFDCVDLGHESAVYQAGFVKDLVSREDTVSCFSPRHQTSIGATYPDQ